MSEDIKLIEVKEGIHSVNDALAKKLQGDLKKGLDEVGTRDLDLVILENVGNLVCPAEFETGATKNAMILSVPEGDDKPLKYPLMFSVCHALVINKMDYLELSDFSVEKCRERVLKLNPDIKIFEVSCRTGQGIDQWADWLKDEAVYP